MPVTRVPPQRIMTREIAKIHCFNLNSDKYELHVKLRFTDTFTYENAREGVTEDVRLTMAKHEMNFYDMIGFIFGV